MNGVGVWLCVACLTGCGLGGGGSSGGGGVVVNPDAASSSVDVQPAGAIQADGVTAATVTVTVRDSDGVALPGVLVSISASDPGMIVVLLNAVTSNTGVAVALVTSTSSLTGSLTVRAAGISLTTQPTVSFQSGPQIQGLARYHDINANGSCDSGDTLVVSFDEDVTVNGAGASALQLPVSGDSLGTAATVAQGPAANEVTVTLGTSPSLRSRQEFSALLVANNGASGVDVSSTVPAEAIESVATGVTAQESTPQDVVPYPVLDAQTLGTRDSCGVALADLDVDGDLDAVLGNFDGFNQVFLNDGTGTLVDSGQSLGTANTMTVALGDLNADGSPDLVCGNSGAGARVYLNDDDGTGNLTDNAQSLGAGFAAAVALGDVNNDGDLDLVLGNLSNTANQVWTNDGSGTFTDSGQTLGTSSTDEVALGDVDGDGDLDLVSGNRDGANRLYTNDGTGTFTLSPQSLGLGDSRGLALGDLDGDGDLDIIVGQVGAAGEVCLNNGAGLFALAGTLDGVDSYAMVLNDIDADGDLDALQVGQTTGHLLWINDGSASFTAAGPPLGSANTMDLAVGDVDGDGDEDWVEANSTGENSVVWNSSLSGTWGTATYGSLGLGMGGLFAAYGTLGDLDSDGDLDLVVTQLGTSSVFLNAGIGLMVDSGQSIGSLTISATALGDLDRDGDLDLVSAGGSGATLVHFNNGAGVFTDSGQSILAADESTSLALGDINGDGSLDLVLGNGSSTNADDKVLTNDGSGTFLDSGQALGNLTTHEIKLGDVDSDGDLDLMTGNGFFGAGLGNRVYTNDGSGVFTDSGQILGTAASWDLCLGDFDLDGDLDIVTGNLLVGGKLWLNNGSGTFTDAGQTLTDGGTPVACADVDGDGDLDLLAATSASGDRLFLNDGTGTLTDSGAALGVISANYMMMGDMDQDGDADLVVIGAGSDNEIWLNN
jgi:hypothetical protein